MNGWLKRLIEDQSDEKLVPALYSNHKKFSRNVIFNNRLRASKKVSVFAVKRVF